MSSLDIFCSSIDPDKNRHFYNPKEYQRKQYLTEKALFHLQCLEEINDEIDDIVKQACLRNKELYRRAHDVKDCL